MQLGRLVDVLVGMQYGSEGKGKIASYLASEYSMLIRSGGPQAGHNFYFRGVRYLNRQIPCGIFSQSVLCISHTAVINPHVLMEEIKRYGLNADRLKIDYRAAIISEEDIATEKQIGLREKLASTCQGVGVATAEKILRRVKRFVDVLNPTLKKYCTDTVNLANQFLAEEKNILIEGTQGFGLSLNYGSYPYVTSRDVTASALLNDAGVSPASHRKTIGVMRPYPIRVGGNSGKTNSKKISWGEIEKRAGSIKSLKEFTSVTGRQRRVFEQDYILLEEAVKVNRPDFLALNFIDQINTDDYGKKEFDDLTEKSKKYIFDLEEKLGVEISLIGTGPEENQIIDRREIKRW